MCVYFFNSHLEQQRAETLEGERQKVRVRQRQKQRTYLEGIQEQAHAPSPPVAFLPGVFVNHPFRSVSPWVGPLPFNAGTFVA